MARSAKQPELKKRRSGSLQSGALALGGMVANNPVLVGGSTAFLVTLFYVSANALWYQPFPHTGAFFATRSIEHFVDGSADEPETTINIVRPAPAPVKSDPVVQQVQGILKDLGFYGGAVDGISGPNTAKAIETYRRKIGLAGSGDIDEALLEQLGAAPVTASVVPQPAPRDQAEIVATAQDDNQPTARKSDARIIKIQAGLKAFGNDDIKLDGVVGSRTKAAIREFQSLFGLPESGEPDEVVYNKMHEIGLTN